MSAFRTDFRSRVLHLPHPRTGIREWLSDGFPVELLVESSHSTWMGNVWHPCCETGRSPVSKSRITSRWKDSIHKLHHADSHLYNALLRARTRSVWAFGSDAIDVLDGAYLGCTNDRLNNLAQVLCIWPYRVVTAMRHVLASSGWLRSRNRNGHSEGLTRRTFRARCILARYRDQRIGSHIHCSPIVPTGCTPFTAGRGAGIAVVVSAKEYLAKT